MSAVGVRTEIDEYAVAIAELPLRARAASTAAGAVVVVDGEPGWGARLRRAADEGAAALVLCEPQTLDPAEFLAAEGITVPIVVERARLRDDVARDAVPAVDPPRTVQVECGAVGVDAAVVLRDAIGWARVLAGGRLEQREARATARAVIVQAERSTGAGASVAVSVLLGRRDSATMWLRGLAVDSARTEVVLRHPVGPAVVVRSGSEGSVQLPPRYESSARVALGRALDAAEGGGHPADLDELAHDSAFAAAALTA